MSNSNLQMKIPIQLKLSTQKRFNIRPCEKENKWIMSFGESTRMHDIGTFSEEDLIDINYALAEMLERDDR